MPDEQEVTLAKQYPGEIFITVYQLLVALKLYELENQHRSWFFRMNSKRKKVVALLEKECHDFLSSANLDIKVTGELTLDSLKQALTTISQSDQNINEQLQENNLDVSVNNLRKLQGKNLDISINNLTQFGKWAEFDPFKKAQELVKKDELLPKAGKKFVFQVDKEKQEKYAKAALEYREQIIKLQNVLSHVSKSLSPKGFFLKKSKLYGIIETANKKLTDCLDFNLLAKIREKALEQKEVELREREIKLKELLVEKKLHSEHEATLKEELTETKGESFQLKKVREALKEKLEASTREKEEQVQNLKQRDETIERLREELNRLKQEKGYLETENTNLKQKLSATEEENNLRKSIIEKQKETIDSLAHQEQSYLKSTQRVADEMKFFEENTSALLRENATLQLRNESLEKENTSLRQENDFLRHTLKNMGETIIGVVIEFLKKIQAACLDSSMPHTNADTKLIKLQNALIDFREAFYKLQSDWLTKGQALSQENYKDLLPDKKKLMSLIPQGNGLQKKASSNEKHLGSNSNSEKHLGSNSARLFALQSETQSTLDCTSNGNVPKSPKS